MRLISLRAGADADCLVHGCVLIFGGSARFHLERLSFGDRGARTGLTGVTTTSKTQETQLSDIAGERGLNVTVAIWADFHTAL